ncbi:hypothetical protein BHE17_04710 [Planococcus maritimus]|nr:hypothetical protein BHE17_04710 [Planococcus maritimus]
MYINFGIKALKTFSLESIENLHRWESASSNCRSKIVQIVGNVTEDERAYAYVLRENEYLKLHRKTPFAECPTSAF